MIIVADAHVSRFHGNDNAFFEMLSALEKADRDVVFLGDIFDLWVAFPRYEGEIHERFLAWCRAYKNRRLVGFVEGNHEFFVADQHGGDFSWCERAERALPREKTLFVHGDLINRDDKNYLRFRKLTKNLIAKTLVRMLPRGPHLVDDLKRKLKNTNQAFRIRLPEEHLRRFARERLESEVEAIFVGHFHQPYRYNHEEKGFIQVLPAWYEGGSIAEWRSDERSLTLGPWEEILSVAKP